MSPTTASPVISVSILTCNRVAALKQNLDRLARQTLFSSMEILVVDNNSSDDTPQVLRRDYPHVRHIRMERNVACAGRNEGLKAARAPIIVTLDDDVFLRRDDELERILNLFNEHPEASAINFKVLDRDTEELLPFNWFHPRRWDQYQGDTFETDYISEGAVAFRKPIFDKTGYYPPEFFLSHEGYDLAYRIIDEGFKLFYSGKIDVLHECAPQQRDSWRNSYYDTRNYIWLIVRRYPWTMLVPHLAYRLITTFLFCVRRGQIRWYFKALWDAIKGLPDQWAQRKPLSRDSLRRLKEIRKLKPSAFFKIKDFILRTALINEKLN